MQIQELEVPKTQVTWHRLCRKWTGLPDPKHLKQLLQLCSLARTETVEEKKQLESKHGGKKVRATRKGKATSPLVIVLLQLSRLYEQLSPSCWEKKEFKAHWLALCAHTHTHTHTHTHIYIPQVQPYPGHMTQSEGCDAVLEYIIGCIRQLGNKFAASSASVGRPDPINHTHGYLLLACLLTLCMCACFYAFRLPPTQWPLGELT